MCDKELLVGHLYGELEPSERRALDEHLATCAECREELESFRATRGYLSSWAPPQPDLGFQIVRSQPAPTRRLWRVSPAWGLAAAAMLVMAVAAAIANVEVRNTSDGLVVRTGWSRAPAEQSVQPASLQSMASASDLEQVTLRLRALEAQLAARPVVQAVGAAAPGRLSDAEILRQVRQWIVESEQRQQGVLARQIVRVAKDVENGRRTDFERIRQSMLQIQGRADETFFRQRAMEDQLLRVGFQR
jgi:hypothetical protein